MDYRELCSLSYTSTERSLFIFSVQDLFQSSSLKTTVSLCSDYAFGHATTWINKRRRHLEGIIFLVSLHIRSHKNFFFFIFFFFIDVIWWFSFSSCPSFLSFLDCKLIRPGTTLCYVYKQIRYSGTPFLGAPILTLLIRTYALMARMSSNLLFLSLFASLLYSKGKEGSQSFISSFVPSPSLIHTLGLKEIKTWNTSSLFYT